jgi:hypothetical protein
MVSKISFTTSVSTVHETIQFPALLFSSKNSRSSCRSNGVLEIRPTAPTFTLYYSCRRHTSGISIRYFSCLACFGRHRAPDKLVLKADRSEYSQSQATVREMSTAGTKKLMKSNTLHSRLQLYSKQFLLHVPNNGAP